MFWIIPIVDPALEISSTVLAFDAVHGQKVTSTEQLNNLKAHRNSFSSFQWLGSESIDSKQTELLAEEYRNIVPVISGDDWSDYRPARPEDFVGRKKILSDILDFLESVNNGNSRTRLFSIKAPSGMGKSSVVLKLASQVTTSRKYSKKFFVYAVDVRPLCQRDMQRWQLDLAFLKLIHKDLQMLQRGTSIHYCKSVPK